MGNPAEWEDPVLWSQTVDREGWPSSKLEPNILTENINMTKVQAECLELSLQVRSIQSKL